MKSLIIDNCLLLLDNKDAVIFDIITGKIYKCRDSLDRIKQKIKSKSYLNIEHRYIRSQKIEWDDGFLLSVTMCSAETCNLKCKYCYANLGTYNNIDRTSKAIMTFEDYKLFFEKILKIFPRGVVNYTFFGGEPMLGFEEIVKFVEYITDVCEKNNLIKPHFAIVTNGTLIDEYAWEIFEKYHFAVTISLDGPKEVNDRMRIFRDEHQSVFDTVKHNLEKCSGRTHVLVAEATLGEFFFRNYRKNYAREYFDTFINLGFDSVSPYFAEMSNTNYMVTNDANLRDGIKQFYYDLVDYSFELLLDDNKCMSIPNFIASTIINIVTRKEKNVCAAGKKSIFYTASGDVYPCQMYYLSKYKKLGNIADENELKKNIKSYKLISRNEISECKSCFAVSFCNFWCPGASYQFANNEYAVNKVRCIIQKSIGERVIYNLALMFENEEKKAIFIRNLRKLSHLYSWKKFGGNL
ncbi:radical SAM/SPASM domain-containing protein [Caldicellulosiruptor morganii]|uniref:Radical SAM protein n=1 Tax=Caldicellulosiruptor morganii TaxID=1387555 RepID=A0ABY7BIW3_9FIRM|nr:radical SAM protein [Caldicellulosiruptor morganii]WAM32770.1 radical SAM protein [Caldicellulosiruptor morganii]